MCRTIGSSRNIVVVGAKSESIKLHFRFCCFALVVSIRVTGDRCSAHLRAEKNVRLLSLVHTIMEAGLAVKLIRCEIEIPVCRQKERVRRRNFMPLGILFLIVQIF